MIWFLSLIVILLTVLNVLGRKHYNYWRNRGVQQSRPWFIVGDNKDLMLGKKGSAELMQSFYQLFPNTRYSGVYRFVLPQLIIRDPQLIRAVTIKDFDHFTDHRAFVDPDSEPLFAKNLLGLKGQEWKDMRAALTTSFTSSKMKVLFGLVTEAAQTFTKQLEESVSSHSEVEMKDTFTRFTIDVIATTAFGVKVNSMGEKNNEFYQMGIEVTDIGASFTRLLKVLIFLSFPKLYKLLGFRILDKDTTDFFENLVRETVTMRKEKNIVRPDMINILMEHSDISIEEITAQVMIFFFAGFDSVSSLMTFMAYELAMNQEIQDRLREEILKTEKDCGGDVTYEALFEMKYMDMVVNESLRKWPPFPAIDRVCTKTYIIKPERNGETELTINKGMSAVVPIFGIQRDPKFYPEPEKFDPERFSPENKDKLTPYTFFSFGSGPRNCIGSRFALMEIKILFFHILRKCRFIVTENTQVPVELSKKFAVNIRPEKGVWLGIKKV